MKDRNDIVRVASLPKLWVWGTLMFLAGLHKGCLSSHRESPIQRLSGQTTLGLGSSTGSTTIPSATKPLSPVVRIGSCLGAKITAQLFIFAAPCLYVGATPKLQMDFVPGVKTILQTSNGLSLSVTILEAMPVSEFDPLVSREELRVLANPRAIFGTSPKLDQDLVAHLDLKDQTEPQMINLALVKIFEKTGSIPVASLQKGRYDHNNMVMVSSFHCRHSRSTHTVLTLAPHEESPLWTDGESIVNDPARMLSPLKTLVLIDGAEAAFPKVATIEPLCLGQNGSPIMTITSQGYHLLGLGFARFRGILVGARIEGPAHQKILKAISTLMSSIPSGQNPMTLSLSCTQVFSLLSDNSSREYKFEDLTFGVRQDGYMVGADDALVLKIDPHDRPLYKVTLNLVEYCTSSRHLCYVGFYRDPVNGGVQVFKLEVEGTAPSLAHWVSAEGGTQTTPLDETSCTLTQAPRRDTL